MKTVLGLKSHSGWAALVAIGADGSELSVVDRRRIELASDSSAKQPYHAAEHLKREAGREMVKRGVAAARQMAAREIRAAVREVRAAKNEVAACAVLVGEPMPDWSVDEILAVHFRMHRAEGALFQDALRAASTACGIEVVAIPAKQLAGRATAAFGLGVAAVITRVAALGKSVGPPWGRDQKDATLAAAIALKESGSGAA